MRHLALCAAIIVLASCASKQAVLQGQQSQIAMWMPKARALVEQHRAVDLSGIGLSFAAGQQMLHLLYDLNRRHTDPNTPVYLSDRAFHSQAVRTMLSALAIYDPSRKNIVINQPVFQRYLDSMHAQGVSRRKAAMTVLIHEMVHAADDIRYDLTAMKRRHRGDKLGVLMVSEGHAELHTESICARAGCLEAFYTANKHYAEESLDQTRDAIPSFSDSSALIYGQGLKFLKSLERKDPTGSLVNLALRHPPGDVLEFFDAASFPDKARADRRTRLYDILEAVELSMPDQTTSDQATRVPEQVLNLFELPNGKTERADYIRQQRERILASGRMNYYYQLNQHSFTSVKVDLYETVSASTAKELAQQLTYKIQPHMSDVKGVGISFVSESQLRELSSGLPDKTQRIVRDIDHETGANSVRYFSSLLVEGRFLIKVDNSNNNELNKQALLEVLEVLQRLGSSV